MEARWQKDFPATLTFCYLHQKLREGREKLRKPFPSLPQFCLYPIWTKKNHSSHAMELKIHFDLYFLLCFLKMKYEIKFPSSKEMLRRKILLSFPPRKPKLGNYFQSFSYDFFPHPLSSSCFLHSQERAGRVGKNQRKLLPVK